MIDLKKLASRFSYKPGYRIELIESNIVDVTIRIAVLVPDAEGKKEGLDWIVSHSYMRLEDCENEKAVVFMVKNAIRQQELHEVDEWLKFDGKCVNEPHPKSELLPR